MGEAKRRKKLGLMPEKKMPDKKTYWAETLTDQQKEEGKKDRMYMLEQSTPDIRGQYRNALASGMKRPIIVVADTRDDYGRQLLKLSTAKGREILRDYGDAGMIPTVIMAFPYGEDALRIFGSTMTAHGRETLESVASMPRTIPVVVVAGHGNLYAGVPEDE